MDLLFGCTVCYGDPASPLSKGAIAGVLVLGAAIVGLLVAFASVFLHWRKRARALEAAATADASPASSPATTPAPAS